MLPPTDQHVPSPFLMQSHMWPDIPRLPMPVSLIAGARDPKFVTINRHMHRVMQRQQQQQVGLHIVAGAGHAVHVEKPMAVLRLLRDIADLPT